MILTWKKHFFLFENTCYGLIQKHLKSEKWKEEQGIQQSKTLDFHTETLKKISWNLFKWSILLLDCQTMVSFHHFRSTMALVHFFAYKIKSPFQDVFHPQKLVWCGFQIQSEPLIYKWMAVIEKLCFWVLVTEYAFLFSCVWVSLFFTCKIQMVFVIFSSAVFLTKYGIFLTFQNGSFFFFYTFCLRYYWWKWSIWPSCAHLLLARLSNIHSRSSLLLFSRSFHPRFSISHLLLFACFTRSESGE